MWKLRKRRRAHSVCATLLWMVLLVTLLTGCSDVRLTTGYRKSEFIRYENEKVGMDRALLLLIEKRTAYEVLFDQNIWTEVVDGITMEAYAKDLVRDTVEHMIFLKKLSKDRDITLTEEEKALVGQAAQAYMATYSKGTEDLPFSVDTVEAYYTELLMAERAFYSITDSVDTEVSTDEARIIDVQYLFFSKNELDDEGNLVKLSESGRNKKKQKAQNVLKMIESGEDIISLVSEYSDDTKYFLELGRGEYDLNFEEAAFALEIGEVSDVVETEAGYYIIKCTNDNVASDYEERKESIVLERRTAMFAEIFESYLEGSELHFNEVFWEEYPIQELPRGTGKLQSVFDEYLGEL